MGDQIPTVTLREYVDVRFDATDKAISAALAATKEAIAVALAAQKEAVLKSENANEKRFENVNEFRATLSDQQARLLPRSEAVLKNDALELRLKSLEDARLSQSGGSVGMKNLWGWIVGIAGFVSLIAGWLLK